MSSHLRRELRTVGLTLVLACAPACIGGDDYRGPPRVDDTYDWLPDDTGTDDDTHIIRDTDTDTDTDTEPRYPDNDGDGVPADQDCSDWDHTVGRPSRGYLDRDRDGFGGGEAFVGCYLVRFSGDCDDGDPFAYPMAPETCEDETDRNCDGFAGLEDNDGDGFAACEDCDDRTAEIRPGGREIWDSGLDEDCNPDTPDRPCAAHDVLTFGMAASTEPSEPARMTVPIEDAPDGVYSFCIASHEAIVPQARFIVPGVGPISPEAWSRRPNGTTVSVLRLRKEASFGVLIVDGEPPAEGELAEPFQVVVGWSYED